MSCRMEVGAPGEGVRASDETFDSQLHGCGPMRLEHPCDWPLDLVRPPEGLERFVLLDEPCRLVRLQVPHAAILQDETLRRMMGLYMVR